LRQEAETHRRQLDESIRAANQADYIMQQERRKQLRSMIEDDAKAKLMHRMLCEAKD
jgi:hypothetical protein